MKNFQKNKNNRNWRNHYIHATMNLNQTQEAINRYKTDPMRLAYIEQANHIIKIAPVEIIVDNKGVTNKILEPFNTLLSKIRVDLKKYEEENYSELLATKNKPHYD